MMDNLPKSITNDELRPFAPKRAKLFHNIMNDLYDDQQKVVPLMVEYRYAFLLKYFTDLSKHCKQHITMQVKHFTILLSGFARFIWFIKYATKYLNAFTTAIIHAPKAAVPG